MQYSIVYSIGSEDKEGGEGGERGVREGNRDLGGGAIRVVLLFLTLLYARRGLDRGVGSSSYSYKEAIS
jgi:hypothetical protein